jgi:hypothetical protein
VAAARTVTHIDGAITVRYLPNVSVALRAIIQPMRHAYCTICLEANESNTTLVVVNASEYTNMFGDNVMRQEYPVIDIKAHAALAVVVMLMLVNAALLAAGCLAWLHARQGPPLETHTAAGFVIRPSIFGMQAVDTATGRTWNARALRHSLAHAGGVSAPLHAHLLESALKME